jgi:hypothetical protein
MTRQSANKPVTVFTLWIIPIISILVYFTIILLPYVLNSHRYFWQLLAVGVVHTEKCTTIYKGGSNFQFFFESDNTISYHYFTGDVHLGILPSYPHRYFWQLFGVGVVQTEKCTTIYKGGSNFQFFFESDNTISYHYFTGDVHLGIIPNYTIVHLYPYLDIMYKMIPPPIIL